MALFLALFFFFLVSSANACNSCIYQSKASFVDSPTTYGGACGYSNFGMEFTNGHFAAAVPSIYNHGARCGACYQVRCKTEGLCNTAGTNIVLIDQNFDNRTDFVLSKKAFSAMALNDKEQELLNSGIIDVEYKRIPCVYKDKKLSVLVAESSTNPHSLSILFLYQGGQTQIVSVDIAEVDSNNWVYLNRNYGAVWSTNRAPTGALQMRMMVSSGYDGKWVRTKSVLPVDWKNGVIYDTGVQIDDIDKDQDCPPSNCGDNVPWK